MKPHLRLLSVVLPLICLLGAAQAEARTKHNQAGNARYVRAMSVDRYPIGARDFYYQFAESRVLAPAAAATAADSAGMGDFAAQVDILAGSAAAPGSTAAPSSRSGTLGLGSSASPVSEDGPRATAHAAEENMSGPPSPFSRLALPIAALGLMLFVARRRSVL